MVTTEDQSLDPPIFEGAGPQIEEKTDRLPRETQIGEHLRLVDGGQAIHGFRFHDHRVIDQEVDPVGIGNLKHLEGNVQMDFQQNPVPFLAQGLGGMGRRQESRSTLCVLSDSACSASGFFT